MRLNIEVLLIIPQVWGGPQIERRLLLKTECCSQSPRGGACPITLGGGALDGPRCGQEAEGVGVEAGKGVQCGLCRQRQGQAGSTGVHHGYSHDALGHRAVSSFLVHDAGEIRAGEEWS